MVVLAIYANLGGQPLPDVERIYDEASTVIVKTGSCMAQTLAVQFAWIG